MSIFSFQNASFDSSSNLRLRFLVVKLTTVLNNFLTYWFELWSPRHIQTFTCYFLSSLSIQFLINQAYIILFYLQGNLVNQFWILKIVPSIYYSHISDKLVLNMWIRVHYTQGYWCVNKTDNESHNRWFHVKSCTFMGADIYWKLQNK